MDDREAARAFLRELGASEEQLSAADQERDFQGFVSDVLLARGHTLSLVEVAARCEVEPQRVTAMWRSLGVTVDDPDAPLFSDDDAALARVVLHRGIFSDKFDDVLRVIGSSVARVAEAVVAAYVQVVEAEQEALHASLLERVKQNRDATELAIATGYGLGPLFQHHLREAIDRQRLSQLGIARRELARVAVGFVDLVGFTSLSRRLDPAELSSLVTRFEMRAFEVTASLGGRVVKHIGDEVMFVSLDPVAACRIALALTDAFTDDGIEPRGGLCAGDVLVLHGDYYGPVVNLASRLTDAAVPGEVLVDDAVVTSLTHVTDVAYEPAGRRQLKGFDDTVRVHALLRP